MSKTLKRLTPAEEIQKLKNAIAELSEEARTSEFDLERDTLLARLRQELEGAYQRYRNLAEHGSGATSEFSRSRAHDPDSVRKRKF